MPKQALNIEERYKVLRLEEMQEREQGRKGGDP